MARIQICVIVLSAVLVVMISALDSGEKSNSRSSASDDVLLKDQPMYKKDLPSSQWKSLKRSKYLSYLFRKYGSGGLISFEGLEHMMHNLGLGGLEFEPDHEVDEHHPKGYRTYEDSLKDEEEEDETGDGANDGTDEVDNLRAITSGVTVATERPSKHVVEIKINEEDNEEIVLVKDIPSHRSERHRDGDEISYSFKATTTTEDDETEDKSSFINLHDPKHHKDHYTTVKTMGSMSCLSPSAMIRLLLKHKPGYLYTVDHHSKHRRHVQDYRYDDVSLLNIDVNVLEITPTDFVEILCPALLTQIERAECVAQRPMHGGDGDRHIKSEKKLFQYAWLYATISILIISMCGLVGVAIVPLMKSNSYNYILMFLVAVAVGTLAGDALMHLLPHALTPHLDHGDDTLPNDHKNDEAVFLCAFAFLAAMFMYVLESLLPLLLNGHQHQHHHQHSHHGHSHNPVRERRSSSIQEEMTLEPGNRFKMPEGGDVEHDLNLSSLSDGDMIKGQRSGPLSPIAFMVILGDGLHNITDGLAIGAAFALDPITGMATALAVLCHELPHELGDFALLLKTGMSIRRALILNIVSSVLSLFGMAFGLILAGVHTSLVRWIYAATAGTFLYIAMADLIPEMTREPEGKTLKSVLCQLSGILIGGLIMLTIALNEDRLRILFE